MHRRLTEGAKFGRLTAIRVARRPRPRRVFWLCVCECGRTTEVRDSKLTTGHTRSCGCLRTETNARRAALPKKPRTKRSVPHPLRSVWESMIRRCTDPRRDAFKYYGARGITVCERWRTSFKAFVADMGPRPEGFTLDRIDSTGNYEPGNCRWASWADQARNRRPRAKVAFTQHPPAAPERRS